MCNCLSGGGWFLSCTQPNFQNPSSPSSYLNLKKNNLVSCVAASNAGVIVENEPKPRKPTIKKTKRKPIITRKAKAEGMQDQWLLSLTPPMESAPEPCCDWVPPLNGPEEFRICNDEKEGGWILGIDPDNHGAIAAVMPSPTGGPLTAQVFDTPTVKYMFGKKIRNRLDARSIIKLLRNFGAPIGTIACVEQALPLPCNGKQGWLNTGFNYGLWIGILVSSGFSVIPIPSSTWKKYFGLSGGTTMKDESRTIASNLFNSLSSQLKRKKDHGRAEALLIATYGSRMGSDKDGKVQENVLKVVKLKDISITCSLNMLSKPTIPKTTFSRLSDFTSYPCEN